MLIPLDALKEELEAAARQEMLLAAEAAAAATVLVGMSEAMDCSRTLPSRLPSFFPPGECWARS